MIVAVTMVKNEDDIIGYTLLHLFAEGIDHVIISDNLSSDRTRLILDSFVEDGMPLTVLDDVEQGFYQDTKMSQLARTACDLDATWILPFDADELWYAPEGTIGQSLNACTADVVVAHGWDHIVTPHDPPGRNPYRTITSRRQAPQKLPKVAFRADPSAHIHNGNHDVDRPGTRIVGPLNYRHFQYRSLEQMSRKVRQGREAFEVTNLHWNYGTHWRTLGSLDDDTLRAHWNGLCAEDGLVVDPAPYRSVI